MLRNEVCWEWCNRVATNTESSTVYPKPADNDRAIPETVQLHSMHLSLRTVYQNGVTNSMTTHADGIMLEVHQAPVQGFYPSTASPLTLIMRIVLEMLCES